MVLLQRGRGRWRWWWGHRCERDTVQVGDEGLPAAAKSPVKSLDERRKRKGHILFSSFLYNFFLVNINFKVWGRHASFVLHVYASSCVVLCHWHGSGNQISPFRAQTDHCFCRWCRVTGWDEEIKTPNKRPACSIKVFSEVWTLVHYILFQKSLISSDFGHFFLFWTMVAYICL